MKMVLFNEKFSIIEFFWKWCFSMKSFSIWKFLENGAFRCKIFSKLEIFLKSHFLLVWIYQKNLSKNQSDFLQMSDKNRKWESFIYFRANWRQKAIDTDNYFESRGTSIDVILRLFICCEFEWKYTFSWKCMLLTFCIFVGAKTFTFRVSTLWEIIYILYNSYVKSIWDHVQNLIFNKKCQITSSKFMA